MSFLTSQTRPEIFVIDVYGRNGISSQDTSSCNRFQWTNPSRERSTLFDIEQPQNIEWPPTLAVPSQADSHSDLRLERNVETDWSLREARGGEIGPLRLYDCEMRTLKDRQTYLGENKNITPSYLVVSHVWGDIKEQIELPTVGWSVPISNKAKLDTILGYCEREKIKWMWMDILCINQSRNSNDANEEKAVEITKMGEYYRKATTCLVVPVDYNNFPDAYHNIMHLFDTVVNPGASVQDNAHYIWESIAFVDAIMSDQWLWRMWTYQEMLLSKKLILLDNQELTVDHLPQVLTWYYKILRNGSLKRPEGGREYDFIHPEAEIVISKNWSPEKTGWGLKKDLDQNGHVDLISLVAHTRDRTSKFPIDRLLGLYGLLRDEEKVPIDPSSHSSPEISALKAVWHRTISKVLASGSVWPLLHDVMDLNPYLPAPGQNWLPDIMAFQRRQDGIEVRSETINHRNSETIAATPGGLCISVRAVGRVVGASTSIGDGGGEMNKIITCAWILMAKGLNTDPIVQQLMDGLATSDAVPPGDVENSQRALYTALHANTLNNCFAIVEHTNLRRKLVFGAGLRGWDKTVLAVKIIGLEKPLVFLAWVHRDILPRECWVLDVTSDPVEIVQRWVVANHVGSSTFRKIGTVCSYPRAIPIKDVTCSPIVFN